MVRLFTQNAVEDSGRPFIGRESRPFDAVRCWYELPRSGAFHEHLVVGRHQWQWYPPVLRSLWQPFESVPPEWANAKPQTISSAIAKIFFIFFSSGSHGPRGCGVPVPLLFGLSVPLIEVEHQDRITNPLGRRQRLHGRWLLAPPRVEFWTSNNGVPTWVRSLQPLTASRRLLLLGLHLHALTPFSLLRAKLVLALDPFHFQFVLLLHQGLSRLHVLLRPTSVAQDVGASIRGSTNKIGPSGAKSGLRQKNDEGAENGFGLHGNSRCG